MVRETLPQFNLDDIDVMINENVGNLVCPAEFDIGENIKAMILSVPEGDDKPSKYPLIFQQSAAMLINKTDLLPYVDFDMEKVRKDVRALNSDMAVFPVSAKTHEGLDGWISWLAGCIDAFFATMK
jgi:hydrogenase nickel incorporation protein HypB